MKNSLEIKIRKFFKILKKKKFYSCKDFFSIRKIPKKKYQYIIRKISENFNIWRFFLEFFFLDKPIDIIKKFLKFGRNFFFEIRSEINEKGNPQGIFQYSSNILKNMKNNEIKYIPKPNFLNSQNDINYKMRAILIDWLIDVHVKFKLVPKTIFLTVNILDRFLSLKSISRQKLQLLGVTAMLIASKYEEIYAPETRDFVYISDNAITKEDIFKMEDLICTTLNFDFTWPSILNFLIYYLKKIDLGKEMIFISIYCLELTLNEISMIRFKYSLIAFAIISNLKDISKKNNKNSQLYKISLIKMQFGYLENDIYDCSNLIKSYLILGQNEKQKLGAVQRKYCSKKYGEIGYSIFRILIK